MLCKGTRSVRTNWNPLKGMKSPSAMANLISGVMMLRLRREGVGGVGVIKTLVTITLTPDGT